MARLQAAVHPTQTDARASKTAGMHPPADVIHGSIQWLRFLPSFFARAAARAANTLRFRHVHYPTRQSPHPRFGPAGHRRHLRRARNLNRCSSPAWPRAASSTTTTEGTTGRPT